MNYILEQEYLEAIGSLGVSHSVFKKDNFYSAYEAQRFYLDAMVATDDYKNKEVSSKRQEK